MTALQIIRKTQRNRSEMINSVLQICKTPQLYTQINLHCRLNHRTQKNLIDLLLENNWLQFADGFYSTTPEGLARLEERTVQSQLNYYACNCCPPHPDYPEIPAVTLHDSNGQCLNCFEK